MLDGKGDDGKKNFYNKIMLYVDDVLLDFVRIDLKLSRLAKKTIGLDLFDLHVEKTQVHVNSTNAPSVQLQLCSIF
jgi:hypothetical protein